MSSRKIPPEAIDTALLSELAIGVKKTFTNAEELFREAHLLSDSGSLSRALFLHQISLEECAKIEILGASATSLLMGNEVDVAKLTNVLLSHAKKNRTNAYFLEVSEEEEAARLAGDFKGASEAFSELQKRFHLKANTAKNASLYVDFKDGRFSSPSESINSDMVREIAALNEQYLAISCPKVEMLQAWAKSPSEITAKLTRFEGRLKELVSSFPEDPFRALETVMTEAFDEIRQQPNKAQNRPAPFPSRTSLSARPRRQGSSLRSDERAQARP